MENLNEKQQLISLCYKEVKPNNFVKTIGFHLLHYNMETKKWSNYFLGKNDQICILQTVKYEQTEFSTLSAFLRYTECFTKTTFYNTDTDFSILTLLEVFSNM